VKRIVPPAAVEGLLEEAEKELPPRGHRRREVLAQRADELAEASEVQGVNRVAIDPSKLEVEREIAKHFNRKGVLAITDQVKGYTYYWADIRDSATVTWKKTLGWEIVKGDCPEMQERKDANGWRVVGDAVLMRIPTWKWEIIRKHEEGLAIKANESEMSAAMDDLAGSPTARQYGIKVHPLASEEDMLRLHARNIAKDEIAKMLRDEGALAQMAPAFLEAMAAREAGK